MSGKTYSSKGRAENPLSWYFTTDNYETQCPTSAAEGFHLPKGGDPYENWIDPTWRAWKFQQFRTKKFDKDGNPDQDAYPDDHFNTE